MNGEGHNRTDMHGPTALKHVNAARRNLRQAAEALGYEDVHALADAAANDETPDNIEFAVRAITNAHSYLDDGEVARLNGVRSDEV